jgi:geranylgeranyl diphosphate synthase type II
MSVFDIRDYLKSKRLLIDSYLESYFENPMLHSILHESMKYSLFAGGKRVRPILALASYEACGGDAGDILPQASAFELIHTYSLIHDDLPDMDNDDFRRGKPTNHKVYGEAMAILAGDALLTEAFLMFLDTSQSTGKKLKPSQLVKAVREIAHSSGSYGMVGGQAQDILSENSEADKDTLEFIHLHKTAELIKASVRVGAILAESRQKILNALTRYGMSIGLLFQIVDDILDIEGTTEQIGKSAGSDARNKKLTYPALFGIDGAKKKADELLSLAIDALKIFSNEADPLREIALYIVNRRV